MHRPCQNRLPEIGPVPAMHFASSLSPQIALFKGLVLSKWAVGGDTVTPGVVGLGFFGGEGLEDGVEHG
jgi:hypothetical protein